MKRLPKGSGYQSYDFGARSYPDSLCSGGRLFDADDCDSDGPTEDIPCAICLKKRRSSIGFDRFALGGEEPTNANESAKSLVANNH